jgi:signal peptidase II
MRASPVKFPARLRWVWLSLAVVFLDRATKAWIESQTSPSWRHEVIHNVIYLVHSSNPGIAFSIFANSSSPALRYLLILGALVIIGIIAWRLVSSPNLTALNTAGLALLLGGATGNLTDRILHGAVTDFLEVFLGSYRWPAFNVADSAVTVGAILLILDVLFSRQHRNHSR